VVATSVGHGYCRAELECVMVFGARLTAGCVVVVEYLYVFLLNTRCSFASSCFEFLCVCPLPNLFLGLVEAYGGRVSCYRSLLAEQNFSENEGEMYLYMSLEMKALRSVETSIIYQSTQYNIRPRTDLSILPQRNCIM